MDNPNVVVSLKPLVVNSWQFHKALISTYPFFVDDFVPKNGHKHYLCIINGREVIVKDDDYIVEIPFRDNRGNEKTILIAMEPAMYLANFLEVDETEWKKFQELI